VLDASFEGAIDHCIAIGRELFVVQMAVRIR
jgi:hypothetical protein